MILTYKELSEKIGLSKTLIDLYASRSELSKYDTKKYKGKNWSRALVCNKNSLKILYNLANLKYRHDFTYEKFLRLYKTLEEE